MRKIRNPAAEIPLPGFEVFYEDFLCSRKEELSQLKAAMAAGDLRFLTTTAHKWKGFCTPYGFQELSELALKLESASLATDRPRCAALLEEISSYLGTD